MNEYDASLEETDLAHPASTTKSEPPRTVSSGDFGAAVPPATASSPERSAAELGGKPKVRRVLTKKKCWTIVAAVLLVPMIGLSAELAASPSASATQPASTGHSAAAGGGSNARSAPAAGGSSGTVNSVSQSGFTMMTAAGQKVTIEEESSTKYKKGSRSISASAIKKGTHILVLGTVSSTTIKATQVIVPTGSGSEPATAASVIPFQKGSPATSKQVDQIPTSYTEGSGIIQSGTTATKATEAALAAYPGGVVDRVVKLSNGEYEVHTIGVNWPHHIFVNQDFRVVGAE